MTERIFQDGTAVRHRSFFETRFAGLSSECLGFWKTLDLNVRAVRMAA